ncbi:hypothetical protein MMC30_001818 [Trapelia coarctata]|nr:hypothetical protein [Trapelia coarctata]
MFKTNLNSTDLRGLLANNGYADFTVKCGNRTWGIHRAIVCTRSFYFKRVCAGNFKVSPLILPMPLFNNEAELNAKEAMQSSITLEDDDPAFVGGMLEYLYTMVYPSVASVFRKSDDLVFDARMYAIADKYDLPDLKRKVQEAFVLLLPNHTEDVLFAEVARAVYELTPQTDRGLRDLVNDILWNNRATMFP